MVHADAIRAAQDTVLDEYVEGLLEPLRARIVEADRLVAEAQTAVGLAASEIERLDREALVLRTRIAELEAHVCPVVPEPEPSPWRLVEDVDLSDPTGWRLETGKPNNAEGYDLPRNASFDAEGLRLWGRREHYRVGQTTHEFTAADARGEGHPIPNHCRVEVTGRGPHARGLWPCVLWLRPLSGSDGEIDLMENFGGQPRVKATLHNEYGTTHKMIPGQVRWDALETPDPAALHTYVMEKTPGRIHITVDGVTLLDAGPQDAPAGFDWERIFETDRQWYPRVTMQVSAPNAATGSPEASFTAADMLVTSLRIYAWEG